jgi:hypothetical protein
MATGDIDKVLRGLGEQLLTLRVTVVLSRNLDGHPPPMGDDATYSRLRHTWTQYLDEVEGSFAQGVEAPGQPTAKAVEAEPSNERINALATPSTAVEPRSAAIPEFAKLAERAEALGRRLERAAWRGDGPSEGPGRKAVAPSTARRPPPSGAVAAPGGPHPSVCKRIAKLARALDTPHTDPMSHVSHQLLLGKAMALGTDPVLLETLLTLDGDVTTRIDEAWLDREDPQGQRMKAILELQRMGIQTAVSWWSGIVELVGKLGRTLVELVLPR